MLLLPRPIYRQSVFCIAERLAVDRDGSGPADVEHTQFRRGKIRPEARSPSRLPQSPRLSGPSLTSTSATSSPNTRTAVKPSGRACAPLFRLHADSGASTWAVSPSSTTSRFSAGWSLESGERLRVLFQESGKPCLEEGLGGLLDPASCPGHSSDRRTSCSSVSSASWVTNSRPALRISVRPPSPPRTRLLPPALASRITS